jgi:hypothetical protein
LICYSQIVHTRSVGAFWKRRYLQLGVPYLAWTGIYLVFTLFMVSLSWGEVWSFLRQNLLMGYSQLYPAFGDRPVLSCLPPTCKDAAIDSSPWVDHGRESRFRHRPRIHPPLPVVVPCPH